MQYLRILSNALEQCTAHTLFRNTHPLLMVMQNTRNSTQHHCTSYNITAHHTTSLHIIQHHCTSYNITAHHTTSLHIIQHHCTSYNITAHHTTYTTNIRRYMYSTCTHDKSKCTHHTLSGRWPKGQTGHYFKLRWYPNVQYSDVHVHVITRVGLVVHNIHICCIKGLFTCPKPYCPMSCLSNKGWFEFPKTISYPKS